MDPRTLGLEDGGDAGNPRLDLSGLTFLFSFPPCSSRPRFTEFFEKASQDALEGFDLL